MNYNIFNRILDYYYRNNHKNLIYQLNKEYHKFFVYSDICEYLSFNYYNGYGSLILGSVQHTIVFNYRAEFNYKRGIFIDKYIHNIKKINKNDYMVTYTKTKYELPEKY